MSAYIVEVASCMRSNRLQLNIAKTEFLWSTTGRRLHELPPFHQLLPFETFEYTSTVMSGRGLTSRKRCRPATRYCVNCGLSVGQSSVSRSVPAYLTDELCQVAAVEARQLLRSSSSSSFIVSRTRHLFFSR